MGTQKTGFIPYFEAITDDNGFVYSCDMMRIAFKYEKRCEDEISAYISRRGEMFESKTFTSARPLRFRTMVTINYTDEASITFGFGLNDFDGKIKTNSYVDFNPNKVFDIRNNCYAFDAMRDIRYILDRAHHIEVKRFDLAVDIPRKRYEVDILRGHRSYARYEKRDADGHVQSNDDNYTQYVGKVNTEWYTKVYNKTAERSLDTDWVRIETTLGLGSLDNKSASPPEVYYIADNYQFEFPVNDTLSPRDRVFVKLLAEKDCKQEILNQLEWRFREKIKPYVFDGYKRLILVGNIYAETIVANCKEYVNGFPKRLEKYLVDDNEKRNDIEILVYTRKKHLQRYIRRTKDGFDNPFDFTYYQLAHMSDNEFNMACIGMLKATGRSQDDLSAYRVCDSKNILERIEKAKTGRETSLMAFTDEELQKALKEFGWI